VFHELIAHWQLINRRPDYLHGQTRFVGIHQVAFDDEMFAYAQECLDRYAAIPGDRHIEVKIDISSLTPIPGQTGTSDLIIVNRPRLDVIDWKYGKGVKVFAPHNTQGLCYAWGAFQQFGGDFDVIRIHIAQPRLEHFDVWEIDRAQLHQFAEWARVQWAEAWSGKAVRVPSPKACQWCRVKVTCPANQALVEALADDTFRDEMVEVGPDAEQDPRPVLTFTAPAELDTARLAWMYQYRKLVEDWFRLIGEELIERGLNGDDLAGLWKVAEGRQGRRNWVDEDVAANALIQMGLDPDDLWLRSLASPAHVEKLLRLIGIKGDLGRRYLSMFTQRANGKPTLVPIGDTRKSLGEVADETFGDADG
jgi:hypothetical protein